MAKQNMLPKRITKILNDMDKLHTKPPMCNDCCGARATRRFWRSKGVKHNQRHLKKATHPGEVISVDQLESSIPGFIGQMTGKLTRQRIVASTVFIDHASDFSYVYHQTSMTSEKTLKSEWPLKSLHYHMEFILNTIMLIMGDSRTTYSPKALKIKDKQ
jgi:hypothetical protein